MIEKELLYKIIKSASAMRKHIIQMTCNTGKTGAHIGGALSLVEVVAVLYLAVLRYDVNDMYSEDRDRLIFSKGHGAMVLYAAMEQAGIITADDLKTFKDNDGLLTAHPSMNTQLGIEFSSGSLGQGLSLGVGTGLALKRKKNKKPKVYVVLGDGECDEGSVWEAAMAATHYGLDNLVVIVDCNHLQYDGPTETVLSLSPLEEKWIAFGWNTAVVDGHDVEALYNALLQDMKTPYVILAQTVKGRGVSFMENNPVWHNGHLTSGQYEQAMAEVNAWEA